jgi:hypothetical protein
VESIIRYTSKVSMLISGTGASRVPRFKSSTVSAFENFKTMAFLYRYDYSYLLKSMAEPMRRRKAKRTWGKPPLRPPSLKAGEVWGATHH